MTEKQAGRMIQMDLLRVVACVMVIVIHVVADGIYVTQPGTFQWYVLSGFMCISRPAVPIFFMISGMFSRSLDGRRNTRKALRYLMVYFTAAVLYRLLENAGAAAGADTLWNILQQGMHEPKYHLWFLKEYVIITLFAPFVNAAVERMPSLLDFAAGLFLAGTVLLQSVKMLFGGHPAVWAVIQFLPDIGMGYMGYFVLGRWLLEKKERISRGMLVLSCGAGILSMVWVFVLVHLDSMRKGAISETYYSNFFLGVFLMALAWVVLFLCVQVPQSCSRWIARIAPQTFGIYLIHVFVIEAITKAGFHAQRITTIIGVPLKTAIVFVISFGLCIGWKKLCSVLKRASV